VDVSHFPQFSVFLPYSRVPRHISRPKVYISHFPWFLVFSPYSMSYSVHFPFFTFFSDFVIIQFVKLMFLILRDFQFSCHIPGPTVCISHFSRYSMILSLFKSSSVCFSFSMIFSFLAIFHVLQCALLIFHVFKWFRHFSSRQVDVSNFPRFSVFLQYSLSYSGHF